jgi:hypothetical protein
MQLSGIDRDRTYNLPPASYAISEPPQTLGPSASNTDRPFFAPFRDSGQPHHRSDVFAGLHIRRPPRYFATAPGPAL